jgi:hypothetical protein
MAVVPENTSTNILDTSKFDITNSKIQTTNILPMPPNTSITNTPIIPTNVPPMPPNTSITNTPTTNNTQAILPIESDNMKVHTSKEENTLLKQLNAIPVGAQDPNRSTLGVFDDTINSIGDVISDITETVVKTSAKVAAIGTETGAGAAETQGLAAVYAADNLFKTASNVAKDQLPRILDHAKEVAEVYTDGVNRITSIIDTTMYNIKQATKQRKIEILMKDYPELTEEEARKIIIAEEKEKEEMDKREKELELERKEAENENLKELNNMEAKIIANKTGGFLGGKKRNTLKNIQKGGKLSAKRIQKSIKEFLKPSITSSSVLKMIKGGKKTAKKRKYNSGLRSKRRI